MITTCIEDRFNHHSWTVEIEPKQFIRVGSREFRIGDKAEYNSYNLSYIGDIVGIGPKTVTIEHGASYNRKRSRLNLSEFCWRNWDFDLAKTLEANAVTSQYI